MQSKISMVIPCFNKVNMIGSMLQSVFNQRWDNIELILVNDGSTDGTREIIAEWEVKLRERGFDVIIIDQENQGVGAAVRNGMLKMSGDYFCTVDSDDNLTPDYCSIMASWLDENPEYDGVSCAYVFAYIYNKGTYKPDNDIIWEYTAEDKNRLENYIFQRMELSACNYLLRIGYIRKLNIVHNFTTSPRCSQEPQLLIPILGSNGKLKHIPKGLYILNYDSDGLSSRETKTFVKTKAFMGDYHQLIETSIRRLDISKVCRERLLTINNISLAKAYINWTEKFDEADAHRQQWIDEYTLLVHRYYPTVLDCVINNADKDNFFILTDIVEKRLLFEPIIDLPSKPPGRVIGCGASGFFAKKLLPFLKATPYYPVVFWDRVVRSTSYGGIDVVKPDFDSLIDDDLLLIFPQSSQVLEEYTAKLIKTSSKAVCISHNQIIEYLGNYLFPATNSSNGTDHTAVSF
jgi:glycosyltransferase involved in cell wall biosynthesis